MPTTASTGFASARKPARRCEQRSGHELKLVYPQSGIDPAELLSLQFDHFWLQPMDGPDRAANTAAAIDYCLDHPNWRLSVQMHKLVGIP